MNIEKKHWITNGAELVQSGDFVRLRGDDGEWSEWGSADHLAGSRVDSFVQWHGMGVQFARVPTAFAAEQPRNLAEAIQRWRQEPVAASDGDEWLTDPTEKIQPGDLYRVREDSHGDYCDWRPADHYAGTEVGFFAAWHSRDIQFCRPAKPAAMVEVRRPVTEGGCVMLPKGYQWITDETERIQPGDLMRVRDDDRSEYREWMTTEHIMDMEVGYFHDWHKQRIQFCRPAQAAAEQPPTPTPDRGSKYHRTITQTLPGDTHGCSVTVDVYDVLRAFGVTCPAAQHAVKKLLCPGLRGQKTAAQDIDEAANSCRRAIELLGFGL